MNNKNRIENIYEKVLMRINRMQFLIAVVTISGLFLLATASPIEAVPGDLDPTFGSGGKVITPFGNFSTAYGVAIQSDGKIVAAGFSESGTTSARNYDFAVVRYNTDGTLDNSFGTGGKVTTDFGGEDIAGAIAIQPDGKIVAAGDSGPSANKDFALARYNTDGSLDTSFGTGGKVVTPISSLSDFANAVAIQSNGKIVVAGNTNSGTSAANQNYDFAVVRYNTDGTLDNSFGTGGKVTTDFGGNSDTGNAVVVQSDGKIIVAGISGTFTSGVGTTAASFALARYNTDGSLDTSFGAGGKVITAAGSSDDRATGAALQTDGKIVVVGLSNTGTTSARNYDFAVFRYNTDGSLDSSFGAGGKVTTPIGSSDDIAHDVAIQSNGKIVVAGDKYNVGGGLDYDFALARYNTDGSLDTSFGTGGKVVTPISSSSDQANAIAIQSDGKIVAAGGPGGFKLVRYLGDAVAARTTPFDFDGDGKADVSVFRPTNGGWYINQSMNGFTGIEFGQAGDKIVPADYDGDGKTDVAVYRLGSWYIQRSQLGFTGVAFGTATDIPMPADFTGDGRAEIAVFRPSDGGWYIYNLVNNQFNVIQFGQAGDVPVAADYDGDGKADIAVFRSGTWYIQRSQLGFTGIAFGQSGDKPVPADYDGDGKADVAVFRNGTWYILRSQAGFTGVAFGVPNDKPAPNAFVP